MYYLKQEVFGKLVDYAKVQAPNEACGLLTANRETELIDSFIPIPNTSLEPRRQFALDPQTFIPLIYQLNEKEVSWVGVVHSHPTSKAYPSNLDISSWHYADKSYWIYSLDNAALQAYFIKAQTVLPVEYRIVF